MCFICLFHSWYQWFPLPLYLSSPWYCQKMRYLFYSRHLPKELKTWSVSLYSLCEQHSHSIKKILLPFIITVCNRVQCVPRSLLAHFASSLPPAILQVVHLKEISEQLPKVQVPLPCSKLASDQYASNVSGKCWRHPVSWSFLTGCPDDWAFINTLQYYLFSMCC